MTGQRKRQTSKERHRIGWGIIAGAFLALVPLQREVDRALSTQMRAQELIYVPSGRILRRLCLGHEGLLADIYWTRVVQYYGRKRIDQAARFDLLGPLLHITTELDPHLLIAYRFGAIFLAQKPPQGAGQPHEALQLLRRGIVANPAYWRLWQDLGFVYYWDLKDYASAARVFQAGSERPGAQVWMKVLAASVALEGGAIQSSRLLWSQIYLETENADIRRTAEEHLIALDAQAALAQLDALLDRFRRQAGRPANSWDELILAGFLRDIPRDPSGVPYRIDSHGRAGLGAASKVNLGLLD